MLTAVDHLVVRVPDLAEGVETYSRLGFRLTRRGEAAYAVFGDLYLEFRDMEKAPPQVWGDRPWLEPGSPGGIFGLVLQSDNLDAEVARLRSLGVVVSDPAHDPVDGSGGRLSRRAAAVDGGVPIAIVEHDHSFADRSAFLGGPGEHPNTASDIERIYLSVESIEPELEAFERVLGIPAPPPEMGTVIMSMMTVFHVGATGIAVAEPRGPGPTAAALASNGRGFFQVLFRARHLDEAEALMVEKGVPAPIRGTRLSGESALLVEPANACNVYVAFAGQP